MIVAAAVCSTQAVAQCARSAAHGVQTAADGFPPVPACLLARTQTQRTGLWGLWILDARLAHSSRPAGDLAREGACCRSEVPSATSRRPPANRRPRPKTIAQALASTCYPGVKPWGCSQGVLPWRAARGWSTSGGCCRPAPELVWMEEGRAELLAVSPSAVPLVPRKI